MPFLVVFNPLPVCPALLPTSRIAWSGRQYSQNFVATVFSSIHINLLGMAAIDPRIFADTEFDACREKLLQAAVSISDHEG